MPKFPRLTGLQVIAKLQKAGFAVLRVKRDVTILLVIQTAGERLSPFIVEKSLVRG